MVQLRLRNEELVKENRYCLPSLLFFFLNSHLHLFDSILLNRGKILEVVLGKYRQDMSGLQALLLQKEDALATLQSDNGRLNCELEAVKASITMTEYFTSTPSSSALLINSSSPHEIQVLY